MSVWKGPHEPEIVPLLEQSESAKRAIVPLAVAISLSVWILAYYTPIQMFGVAGCTAIVGLWSTRSWKPVRPHSTIILGFGIGRMIARLMLTAIASISFLLFTLRLYVGTNL